MRAAHAIEPVRPPRPACARPRAWAGSCLVALACALSGCAETGSSTDGFVAEPDRRPDAAAPADMSAADMPDAAPPIWLDVLPPEPLPLDAPPTDSDPGSDTRFAGQPCDPSDGRCAGGTFCVEVGDGGRCAEARGPTVLSGVARWFGPGQGFGGRLRFRIEAVSPFAAIDATRVTPLDAYARPVGHTRTVNRRLATGPASIPGRYDGVLVARPALLAIAARDDRGAWSSVRYLPILDARDVAVQSACDPDELTHLCARSAVCRVAEGDDTARCHARRFPTIEAGDVLIDAPRALFHLWASGRSPREVFDPTIATRFVLGGEPAGDWLPLAEDRAQCDAGVCDWGGRSPLPEAVEAQPDAPWVVEVRFESESGEASSAVEVRPLGTPRRLPEGARCDDLVDYAYCAEGTHCARAMGYEGRVCLPRRAPRISEARVTYNADTGALGLWLSGRDADGDNFRNRVRLIDAEGQPLPRGRPWLLGSDMRVREIRDVDEPPPPDVHEASGSTPLDELLPDDLIGPDGPLLVPDRAWVRMVDNAGLVSRWLDVPVEPTPTVGAGAACDYGEGVARCARPLQCLDSTGLPYEFYRCVAPVDGCPDGWRVASLNAAPNGSGWRLEGNVVDGPGTVERGWRAVPDAVHTFDAPEDAWYRFETDRYELYLRSGCTVPGPPLGAQPLPERGWLVELRAGQRVYAMIGDGVRHPPLPDEPFVLTVERYTMPRIHDAAVYAAATGTHLDIELLVEPGSTPSTSLRVHLVDEHGEPRRFGYAPALIPVGRAGRSEAWRARLQVPEFDWPAGGPPAVQLAVRDADQLAGSPTIVAVSRPEVVDAGAACDPMGARSVCAAPLACPELHDTPTCRPMPAACPADWPVRALRDFERDDGWLVFGEVGGEGDGDAVPGVASPALETAGAPHVWRFVAPHRGRFRFRVVGYPSRIFIRRVCAVAEPAGPAVELRDEALRATTHQSELDLHVGEAVYVFVDLGSPHWRRRPYALQVEPL